jgi:hypothetical protein
MGTLTMMISIFGDSISGNFLKVKWTANFLEIPYQWIEIDSLKGESRTRGKIKQTMLKFHRIWNDDATVLSAFFTRAQGLRASSTMLLEPVEEVHFIHTEPSPRNLSVETGLSQKIGLRIGLALGGHKLWKWLSE